MLTLQILPDAHEAENYEKASWRSKRIGLHTGFLLCAVPSGAAQRGCGLAADGCRVTSLSKQ